MISRSHRWWGLSGFLLVGLHLFLWRISPRFAWGGDPAGRPIFLLVALQAFSGLLYLLAIRTPRSLDRFRGLTPWIIGIGLAIRIPMLFSTPMLEDDYYRYLWDGGVAAHGENPYAWSPSEIRRADASAGVPPGLRDLARASTPVIDRINHPDLRTIYPPVAQGAFALGHAIAPWRLGGWRVALLLFDGATLLLILAILRATGAPRTAIAIYWWNPLLVKEIFNSGHMDVVVLPFVLGALLLAARGRRIGATFALAAATGVKLWPIALLPIVLRPRARGSSPGRRAGALLLFAGVLALLAIPVVTTGLDPASGFTAYGARWEMNDAFFLLIQRGANLAAGMIPRLEGHQKMLARLLALLLFAAWTARVTRRSGPLDLRDLTARALAIVAAAFLLSPTQFPWYSLWMLPLLAIHPRASLLLLTALLPAYNLRFWFRTHADVSIFDDGLVWIEYLPVWILLALEWWRTRRRVAPGPIGEDG